MPPTIRYFQATCVLVAFSMATAWAKTAIDVFEAAALSIVVVLAKDAKGKTQGMGSGVVIGEEEIVTNCHVIEDAAGYAVRHGKRQFTAQLKHTDWTRDVCGLTVKGLSARVAPLGSTKRLKVGQKVFAIGAPQGLELTLSEGILSSLRELDGGQYLQISAPISPGSSGGGLFDEEGRLIGLPTFYLSEGQQLNFAVPVEWVRALPQRTDKSKARGPTRSEWLAKAMALDEKQDWAGLLKHAREWAREAPGEAAAWNGLGIAYKKAGQVVKSIEAYQQALRIDPEYAETWYNLGNAYDDSGQATQALEAYQQALRIDSEFMSAWNNLGVAYFNSGQVTQAIQAYEQMLRIDPNFAPAWRSLGIAYKKTGQVVKSIEAYQQALRIDPEYAETWYNLGNAYINSDQATKAIEAYQQALRIAPDDAAAWFNLGIAYMKSDQAAKAIEAYQQALSIDPEYAAAWFNLGIAYELSGLSTKATEVYQRLKRLDPKLAKKFFELVILP